MAVSTGVVTGGMSTVQVSWTAPPAPPGNGYRITTAEPSSLNVTVMGTSADVMIAPGTYTFQITSLSEHLPGQTATTSPVAVGGEEYKLY